MRSQSFAFLAAGSGMQSNSQGTRQVKKSVEAGVEQKDIKIVVRPVIMVWRWFCYIKSREEVKMLVFSLGVTRTGLQMSSLCERAG